MFNLGAFQQSFAGAGGKYEEREAARKDMMATLLAKQIQNNERSVKEAHIQDWSGAAAVSASENVKPDETTL